MEKIYQPLSLPFNANGVETFSSDEIDHDVTVKMNRMILALNNIGQITNETVAKWNEIMRWLMQEGGLESEISKILLDTDKIEIDLKEIGDLTTLKTTIKNNLVNAINELVEKIESLKNSGGSGSSFDSRVGDLTQLKTQVKDTIVQAINELATKVDSFSSEDSRIGDMTQLQTQNKDKVVLAINEVFQSVNDGKNLLETTIIDKGGSVSKVENVATFDELNNGIISIPTGSGDGGGDYTSNESALKDFTESVSFENKYILYIDDENNYYVREFFDNTWVGAIYNSNMTLKKRFTHNINAINKEYYLTGSDPDKSDLYLMDGTFIKQINIYYINSNGSTAIRNVNGELQIIFRGINGTEIYDTDGNLLISQPLIMGNSIATYLVNKKNNFIVKEQLNNELAFVKFNEDLTTFNIINAKNVYHSLDLLNW